MDGVDESGFGQGAGISDSSRRSSASRVLADLYRSEFTNLRIYLTRILKAEADAEDVAQEAFLRLHRQGSLDDYAHPRAVLFKTSYRLALNRLRSRRNGVIDRAAPILDEAQPESPTPTAEEAIIAREQETAYVRALASLPPRCRQVIELRTVQELSYKQMSDSLGISVSTLEKHLVRGKRVCAEALAGWSSGGGRASFTPDAVAA
ncbi:sigma-70 family RNA polymerase sigma factor [Phenylobacterium sp.]|uniref:RNA polymerase sigma factor n=1 Tax=Phenylobacterium sp. TaxID=1871053 RepID=UPI0025F2C49A|nr:sigma-70 family RNA polymerase sigma factor [Phenylobacterium sp.]MBX3483409.1 sigma-70 family RNA polymerase sigma factor [Phenylobacterium sp.]MCW5758538.1 sigma-70 family RNA polymerase sigma factor [Phenylobacterium sp.]